MPQSVVPMTGLESIHNFSYSKDDGFQVKIPNGEGFEMIARVDGSKIRDRLFPVPPVGRGTGNIVKPPLLIIPKEQGLHWWLAQSLHYGLPIRPDKELIQEAIRRAILDRSFRVPAHLLKYESILRKRKSANIPCDVGNNTQDTPIVDTSIIGVDSGSITQRPPHSGLDINPTQSRNTDSSSQAISARRRAGIAKRRRTLDVETSSDDDVVQPAKRQRSKSNNNSSTSSNPLPTRSSRRQPSFEIVIPLRSRSTTPQVNLGLASAPLIRSKLTTRVPQATRGTVRKGKHLTAATEADSRSESESVDVTSYQQSRNAVDNNTTRDGVASTFKHKRSARPYVDTAVNDDFSIDQIVHDGFSGDGDDEADTAHENQRTNQAAITASTDACIDGTIDVRSIQSKSINKGSVDTNLVTDLMNEDNDSVIVIGTRKLTRVERIHNTIAHARRNGRLSNMKREKFGNDNGGLEQGDELRYMVQGGCNNSSRKCPSPIAFDAVVDPLFDDGIQRGSSRNGSAEDDENDYVIPTRAATAPPRMMTRTVRKSKDMNSARQAKTHTLIDRHGNFQGATVAGRILPNQQPVQMVLSTVSEAGDRRNVATMSGALQTSPVITLSPLRRLNTHVHLDGTSPPPARMTGMLDIERDRDTSVQSDELPSLQSLIFPIKNRHSILLTESPIESTCTQASTVRLAQLNAVATEPNNIELIPKRIYAASAQNPASAVPQSDKENEGLQRNLFRTERGRNAPRPDFAGKIASVATSSKAVRESVRSCNVSQMLRSPTEFLSRKPHISVPLTPLGRGASFNHLFVTPPNASEASSYTPKSILKKRKYDSDGVHIYDSELDGPPTSQSTSKGKKVAFDKDLSIVQPLKQSTSPDIWSLQSTSSEPSPIPKLHRSSDEIPHNGVLSDKAAMNLARELGIAKSIEHMSPINRAQSIEHEIARRKRAKDKS